jgi:hypothetical protein
MVGRTFAAILVAGALAGSGLAGGVSANQDELMAILSGANEVPGPGSPDGDGMARVFLDPAAGSVCYEITVMLSPPAAAAHIHRGAADVSGPVVVPFDAPSTGNVTGCSQGVDAALIAEIAQTPANFYVNVHNPDFPAGAIRGQLGQ